MSNKAGVVIPVKGAQWRHTGFMVELPNPQTPACSQNIRTSTTRTKIYMTPKQLRFGCDCMAWPVKICHEINQPKDLRGLVGLGIWRTSTKNTVYSQSLKGVIVTGDGGFPSIHWKSLMEIQEKWDRLLRLEQTGLRPQLRSTFLTKLRLLLNLLGMVHLVVRIPTDIHFKKIQEPRPQVSFG